MRMLIRILFVIFIANVIDCFGSVCDNCCDNCCDCFKEKDEYEEIKEDKNITAKSLVNDDWYYTKKNNLVLKIFKKKDDDFFPSKNNGDKISFKLDKDNNSKIVYQNETETENENEPKLEDPLNLNDQKYALFRIKTRWKNTVYLYCSDVESSEDYGIFKHMDHISISVIACDTTNVKNIKYMFCECSNLENLDLSNFNTTNVTNMGSMFSGCISLTKLEIVKNFNTEKVTNMGYMFYECIKLENLNLNNFNTEKVTNMMCMFCLCSKLKNLEISNFNTTNVTNMKSMFFGCSNFPEDIRNKLDNVEEVIKFFKEKTTKKDF